MDVAQKNCLVAAVFSMLVGAAQGGVCAELPRASRTAAEPPVEQLVERAAVERGLAIHVGTTDGRLEIALARGGQRVVHGLALEDAAAARGAIGAEGLCGLASVERWFAPPVLPYAENLVNLLVADLDRLGTAAPARDDILRVLAPQGAAMLKQDGRWTRVTKPTPAGVDEWTHWWYDATGVGASKDQNVRPANSLRWIANNWETPQMHAESASGMRVGGGCAVYSFKSGKKGGTHSFVGRDAFSGVIRWKRDDFSDKRYPVIAAGGRVYAYLEDGKPAVALDGASGAIVATYAEGLAFVRPKVDRNLHKQQILLVGGKLIEVSFDRLVVLDAASGKRLLDYTEPNGDLNLPVVSARENTLFAVVSRGDFEHHSTRWPAIKEVREIVAIDLATGRARWRTPLDHNLTQIAWHDGTLALFNGDSIGGDRAGFIGAIRTSDGKLLWSRPFKDFILNMIVWQDMLVYAHADVFFVDLVTGEEKLPKLNVCYNPRCVRMTASRDYIATGITTWIDREQTQLLSSITRSQCATGGIPAYGWMYYVVGGCKCIAHPLRGYMALGHETPPEPIDDARRLQRLERTTGGKSQAAGATPPLAQDAGKGPIVDDWTQTTFPYAALKTTEPVRHGDVELVAVTHEHRLEARREGKVAWSFTAGGRIGTPPVVYRGRVHFGSHDGWVYCLAADSGRPLWRFLAAPADKKVVAYNQIESAWPVYGVTLYDGGLAFCAGRHSEVDGGLWVWSLDPETGNPQWKVRITTPAAKIAKGQRARFAYPLPSTTNAVLAYENGRLKFPPHVNGRNVLAGVEIDPKDPKDAIVTSDTVPWMKKKR